MKRLRQLTIKQVQSCWNAFESELVRVVDEVAPLVEFLNNSVKSVVTPPVIKNKLNTRKRLLSKLKRNPSNEIKDRVRALNCEIKTFYYGRTKQIVSRDPVNELF